MDQFNYRFVADHNLIELLPAGVVQVSDILRYANEALEKDLITPGVVEYYDLSAVTNIDMDYKSALALRETLREWIRRGWQGSVFYAPDDHHFGMIRMIGAVVLNSQDVITARLIPTREPIDLKGVRAFLDRNVPE